MIDGLTITENYEITTNENVVKITSSFTDAELDEINCEFLFDETVVIDTKDFEYITLTLENLEELIKMVKKSNNHFNKIHKEELQNKN